MPIYVFSCPQGHGFDKIVPCGTKSAKCPECGKKALRKGMEVPAKRNPEHGIQK